jgi:hypothetical protein
MQRPLPSIEMRFPARFSRAVQTKDVNCAPQRKMTFDRKPSSQQSRKVMSRLPIVRINPGKYAKLTAVNFQVFIFKNNNLSYF